MVNVPEAERPAPGHDLLQRGDDLGIAAGAQHAVHLGQLLHQLLLVALGQAAGDQQLLQLPLVLEGGQLQNILDGLALGRVDKAAGIEHRHIGPRRLSGHGVARLAHQGHHLFGIHQVLGAAKRYECNLQNRNSPLIFGILQAQQAVGGALKKAGQLHQLFNGR